MGYQGQAGQPWPGSPWIRCRAGRVPGRLGWRWGGCCLSPYRSRTPLAVAPTYHVGSFDDDANYLMAAHVLASGGWLTSTMPSGATVVANYLPGYPLLLVPVVWLFGSALWAPRVLSGLLVGALYPLLWAWMRPARPRALATHDGAGPAGHQHRLGHLLDHGHGRSAFPCGLRPQPLCPRPLGRPPRLAQCDGSGSALGGVGVAQGGRHRPGRRAGGLPALAPALGAGRRAWAPGWAPCCCRAWCPGGRRAAQPWATATPVRSPTRAKAAWSTTCSPRHVRTLGPTCSTLRQSVLPEGSPLPAHGPVHVLVTVVGVSVPVFVILGAVVWYRRHPKAESWMLWAYFAETLAYPFTNQRRVVLVLPLVTLWFVVGAGAAGRWAVALRGRQLSRAAVSAGVAGVVLFAGVPTAAGFTKNYQWPVGQKSSEFARSPAILLLKAVGPRPAVVETDYRGTVAYFTGHRTAWTAFTTTTPYGPFGYENNGNCRLAVVETALRADEAKFLMVGDVNSPGLMDSPCLLGLASSLSTAKALGAVRLLSTSHDQTSVFELLGPDPGNRGQRTESSEHEGTSAGARTPTQRPKGRDDRSRSR